MKPLVFLAISVGATTLVACVQPPEVAGRRLYSEFCVSCHGTGGTGDGAMASRLPRVPADLTGISARNGGEYPLAEVLSAIDGYTRAHEGNLLMPEFGVMMEDGPLVTVDTGDGIPTPVPERLLALAEYLRTIQE